VCGHARSSRLASRQNPCVILPPLFISSALLARQPYGYWFESPKAKREMTRNFHAFCVKKVLKINLMAWPVLVKVEGQDARNTDENRVGLRHGGAVWHMTS
jgi:hypothetical protein